MINGLIINNARACSFTGHRIMEQGFNINPLTELIQKKIDEGYDTFLVGMALGFDTLVFQQLEKFREINDIKIIACIPCPNQDAKFDSEQKKEYKRMLDSADEKVLVSQHFSTYCMQKRNRFMVDNSSCLIAYLIRDFGGSFKTVEYATKKGLEVIVTDLK